MDKNFEIAAKNWIEQYSADIMEKVENLLNENDSSPEELASAHDFADRIPDPFTPDSDDESAPF